MKACTYLLNGYKISLSDKTTCSGKTYVCVSFNSIGKIQLHPHKFMSWGIRHWHLPARYFSWCSGWL